MQISSRRSIVFDRLAHACVLSAVALAIALHCSARAGEPTTTTAPLPASPEGYAGGTAGASRLVTTAPASASGPSQKEKRVAELIRQLGDDDYKLRQDAQEQLIRMGSPAVRAALEQAAQAGDSEVRQRASDILSKLVDTDFETRSAAIRKSVLWTHEVSGGAAGEPLVTDGKVIFLGGDRLLHAVDPAAGKKIWEAGTFTIKVGECDPPAVSGESVFLTDSVDKAYAIELATGKHLWRTPSAAPRRPCAAGGLMYFTDANQVLWALDAAGGDEKWKLDAGRDRKAPACLITQPAISKGVLYTGDSMEMDDPDHLGMTVFVPCISALEASTGKPIWRVKSDAPASNLVISGENLYFKTGALVGAMEPGTGKKLWQFSLPGLLVRADLFAVADGAVYTTCFEELFAIDSASGEKKWSLDFCPANERPEEGKIVGLAAGRDGVYVALPEGLHAIDPKTGKETWAMRTANVIVSGPAVADGVLYFGTSQQANKGADPKKDFAAPPGLHAIKLK